MPCVSSRFAARRAIPRVGEHDDGRSVENRVGVEVPTAGRDEARQTGASDTRVQFHRFISVRAEDHVIDDHGRDERRETREVDLGGIRVQIVDGRILDVVVRNPDPPAVGPLRVGQDLDHPVLGGQFLRADPDIQPALAPAGREQVPFPDGRWQGQ